jgi:hypothetical protein
MVLAAMRVNTPAAAQKTAWRCGGPKIYHVDKRPSQTNSTVLRWRNIHATRAQQGVRTIEKQLHTYKFSK